ncbi:F0F1 ATP synthase subunit delta [Candidatus Methylacidithermus pantelleriae]|uniref:ATP synthase, F1 complex, delta subunit n=1 Tax=Candidatus Methylacidithermus pantelleriae TaxID=2744239 RepID=A0A8J2BQC9_9BACT|nr:F0F1 ATP synthase subunit delta [Candidatus Methylacidithermus pantelleriae]CAF0689647.1 ATP synthase, F1 complex, delta subunit [Candidatus Methylacidithermus pantelleriae]
MKVGREAKKKAKSLFRQCLLEGELDPEKFRVVVREFLQQRPRGYRAVLVRLRQLVACEISRRTFRVTSAQPLPDEGEEIFRRLEERFGSPLAREFHVDPDLIAGLRIQVGSQLWDGSLRARLKRLEEVLV